MNRPPDTLIILSPAFAKSESDSWLPAQEQFVRALNRNFPALQIIILTFHYPVQEIRQYYWHGNKVITFSAGMKGKINSLILWKQVWDELKQINTAHSVVGIFSFFCSECAFIGHYFSKYYRLKHHIWVLGQDAKKENKQVRRIRPSSDELVCISDFLVRKFEESHGVRPAYMIPIGVDVLNENTDVSPRTVDVLGVGALIPLKQYDVFIDIVKQLIRSKPDINGIICGDGVERQRLESMLKTSNLQDYVKLVGKKPQQEVLQLMQQSRILLHPSSYEGLGSVCIEALSAGAHVISFCKPIDASIDHWHIVQSTDEMVSKTLELLNAPDLNNTPVVPFRIDDTAVQIMRLYGYNEESRS